MRHLPRDLDPEQLKRFMFGHPSLTPEILYGNWACINPPSAFALTSKLEKWRADLRLYCQKWPDDPDWPQWLDCVEAALKWRERVPLDYRFWKPDRH